MFPFILAALSLAHLAALHQYGSTNPLGINAQTDLVDFYPYFYVKDLVATLGLALFAAFLVGFYPEVLGHPDNNIPANPYSTPAHIVPEYNTCSQDLLFFYKNSLFWKNPTRCGNLLIMKKTTYNLQVKMFFFSGKSAREEHQFLKTDARAKILQQMPSLQRLNVGHSHGFINWLSGLIDGDGCFYFYQSQKGNWVFRLKIGQSDYNLKLLNYLKKKLKCGSVKKAGPNHSQYYLANPILLYFYLIPKFQENPFLTRKKAWQYHCFKKALEIYIQAKFLKISLDERNLQLQKIFVESRIIPSDFKVLHPSQDLFYPNLGWLIGFTEAEGSFYLNKKTVTSLVHCVSWSQKDEKELLECIRSRFRIQAKVSLNVKENHQWYKLVTASRRTIALIIPQFEGQCKGIKAVEIRKWARSFRKHQGNFAKLSLLQRDLRQKKKHIF